MEDLISSMSHGVHVGRQGYELSALQVSIRKPGPRDTEGESDIEFGLSFRTN